MTMKLILQWYYTSPKSLSSVLLELLDYNIMKYLLYKVIYTRLINVSSNI